MKRTMKHTGQARSVSGGLAISALLNILITLLISMIIAFALNLEKISWEEAGYWIMVMLFSASFIGAKAAVFAVQHQRIAISMMSGLLYWGLMLCITALFFGGTCGSVWETAAVITAGCGSAALIAVPTKSRKRRK